MATNEHSVSDFERDLMGVINSHSLENQSGTPDFLLAEYLMDCLRAFNRAVAARAEWRGEPVEFRPGQARLLDGP